MIEVSDLLDVDDELILYLVANKLKPAGIIDIDPRNKNLDQYVNERSRKIFWFKWVTKEFKEGVLEELTGKLSGIPITFQVFPNELVEREYRGLVFFTVPISYKKNVLHQIKIGSSEESLEKLLAAKIDEERGVALGFPQEAVNAYLKVIDDERRDGSYVAVALGKAKKAGLELPTWLAYLVMFQNSWI